MRRRPGWQGQTQLGQQVANRLRQLAERAVASMRQRHIEYRTEFYLVYGFRIRRTAGHERLKRTLGIAF